MIQLAFDPRDDKLFEDRGMQNLYWLDDLGAIPLPEMAPDTEAFLFAGARSIRDYRELIASYPRLHDTPEARAPLLNLDTILEHLERNKINVPRPQTWILRLDDPIPKDLRFPLFVRTAKSSWKLGGRISKVNSVDQLVDEAFELRRAFGFDQPILARQWLDILKTGESTFGPVPLEIRTWIVDGIPYAWSFHHLQTVGVPAHFPLAQHDINKLFELAAQVVCFDSRLVCADFVKTVQGEWMFLEAGPGSCAGTAHEFVFKSVAAKVAKCRLPDSSGRPDDYGDLF